MLENPGIFLAIIFGMLFFLIAMGLWYSVTMGLIGVIVLYFWVGRGLQLIGNVEFNVVNVFTYTMIPLFIFMGELVFYGGLGRKLYKGATPLVEFLPGGLLHTNIVACAIFSAVTGSSMACAATIGTVAIPELEERGYSRKLTLGSLAAGGTLGILIPPSLLFVVYGSFVGENIAKLFIAGVFPGMILAGLFMIWIAVATIIRPSVAPERSKPNPKAMALAILDIWPMLVLIFFVLGTIYLGVATPTEAAALGAVMAAIFCAIYRKLTWPVVKHAATAAVRLSSWVMLIVIGAQILSAGLALLQVPLAMSRWATALEVNRLVIFGFVVLLYIVMGMFMEGFSIMFLTLPVLYPLLLSLGFGSLWFGVIVTLLMEMAMVTPPYGTNLFVIQGIAGKKYLKDIITGVTPFTVCMLLLIILLTAFPSIATWLPAQMSKG
ncbi:MAG: TRAP transporter large permease subunit [Chloroflexi bacterium]|nr:TRAP transporter large permease subunit [Chloroflexota bacterium]